MDTTNQTDEQMMRDALGRIAAVLREGNPRRATLADRNARIAYSIAVTTLSLVGVKQRDEDANNG